MITYWYSKKLPNKIIQLSNGMEHSKFISDNFEIFFPKEDKSKVSDFRDFALKHEFARITKYPDKIIVHYNDNFKDKQDLWKIILEQIGPDCNLFVASDTPDFENELATTRDEVEDKLITMSRRNGMIKSSTQTNSTNDIERVTYYGENENGKYVDYYALWDKTADRLFVVNRDDFISKNISNPVKEVKVDEHNKTSGYAGFGWSNYSREGMPKNTYEYPDEKFKRVFGIDSSRSQANLEGYNCGHKGGGDLNDNPYDKDTQNEDWDAWRRGYSEGDEDRIHSSRQITSAKSEEEFRDVIIQVEDILGVNVEHGNIFNLNSEIDEDTEYKIDDICRQYDCEFVPVNGSRRQYRLIQSSRRIQSMKTPKNVYLNEDTQKLIQRLEKRVGHELKLKFEEDNTPYVEIEKLPKGGYSFITDKYLNNLAENYLFDGYKEKQDSFIVYLDPAIMYTKPGIKSAYTREDYDRFDEVGNFIPYNPTEEELAKKDEIKTVLRQELSDAYEPDPMDDYVGYDSTNERIDMACERVAKQFGVDTDFVEEIAGEIDRENIARANAEPEYVYQHCKDKDRFWDWYNGEDVSLEELGIDKEQMDKEVDEVVHKYVNSSRKPIKSSIITPWDTNQVTGTSDEDLGLSAVVDIYGNEFVNVDESTLNELKDTLVRYFDDEAYVRDWNINNPDYQIEDAFEVTDPEEMSAEELARYFDYESYGRDIRLEDNMVWDSENQYWISAHDVDDEELNNDKYIFMRG